MKTYFCPVCSELFVICSLYIEHLVVQHRERAQVIEALCRLGNPEDRYYIQTYHQKDLKESKDEVSTKTIIFSCLFCEATFITNDELFQHIPTQHCL